MGPIFLVMFLSIIPFFFLVGWSRENSYENQKAMLVRFNLKTDFTRIVKFFGSLKHIKALFITNPRSSGYNGLPPSQLHQRTVLSLKFFWPLLETLDPTETHSEFKTLLYGNLCPKLLTIASSSSHHLKFFEYRSIRFMSRVESDFPDSCSCASLSPRLRSNSFGRSFSYRRLPPQLLRLSVLKLDGSSFEVQVARKATVAELRDAVERVFCQMSMNKEDIKISWPHVWGHFCLCYKHFKLINDKSQIEHFGIRDGDQLHFVNREA